jgi:hypothetical protein
LSRFTRVEKLRFSLFVFCSGFVQVKPEQNKKIIKPLPSPKPYISPE